MKKAFISMALAVLCTGAIAQTTNTTNSNEAVGGHHCIAMADDQTWTTLGLTQDQVRRVKEIQTRYKDGVHKDRGTENTMRGTADDRATPQTGTGSGNTGTNTRGTTGTTGTERGTTGTNTERGTSGTTGTTTTDSHGTTGKTSTELGYDDTQKEAMERELKAVLTTAQFDRYREWCQDQDMGRGDRNTDMDR